jgi:hypothetical protein
MKRTPQRADEPVHPLVAYDEAGRIRSHPVFSRGVGAFALAQQDSDTLLESYAVRHIGDHLPKHDRDQGIARLRRSYHLRTALSVRPQTAAAAVTLAGGVGVPDAILTSGATFAGTTALLVALAHFLAEANAKHLTPQRPGASPFCW